MPNAGDFCSHYTEREPRQQLSKRHCQLLPRRRSVCSFLTTEERWLCTVKVVAVCPPTLFETMRDCFPFLDGHPIIRPLTHYGQWLQAVLALPWGTDEAFRSAQTLPVFLLAARDSSISDAGETQVIALPANTIVITAAH